MDADTAKLIAEALEASDLLLALAAALEAAEAQRDEALMRVANLTVAHAQEQTRADAAEAQREEAFELLAEAYPANDWPSNSWRERVENLGAWPLAEEQG